MNYTFAPSAPAPLLRGHLHLGGSNPKGEQIAVTSRYLERNARPWLPVMGNTILCATTGKTGTASFAR